MGHSPPDIDGEKNTPLVVLGIIDKRINTWPRCCEMPHRDCKSSYEVLTMGLIFAAVILLATTTTEAASAQIRCFPYSMMMGENGVAPSNGAALSPSSVLCLFPNVDMFSGAMARAGAGQPPLKHQEERPP